MLEDDESIIFVNTLILTHFVLIFAQNFQIKPTLKLKRVSIGKERKKLDANDPPEMRRQNGGVKEFEDGDGN